MEIVYRICGGIDLQAKFLIACLIGDGKKEKRRFSTLTDDLLKLREWLVQAGGTHVQIESTGIYWKPVLNILESALTLILINPEPARPCAGTRPIARMPSGWPTCCNLDCCSRASFRRQIAAPCAS
jgi:hypothetical protein